jgi:hypothetical protein
MSIKGHESGRETFMTPNNSGADRPQPPSELTQLQVMVRHLLDVWPGVLQRREFLRNMSQSEQLREALEHTYAAHVFNAMHGALSSDLVRTVGAFIFDRAKNSGSVARALMILRKPAVLTALQIHVYGVIPPAQSGDSAVLAAIEHLQRTEFRDIITGIPAELDGIEAAVLNSPMAEIVEEVRNKLVAHASIEHDGQGWKVWSIDGIKLTYAQLDEYIDRCTSAVDKLSHRVLRHAYAFDDQPARDSRYADDYIDALVRGLTEQKLEREKKQREIKQRTAQLFSGDMS